MATHNPSLDDLPKPPPNWAQRPAGISLCMIVRDEERFLGDALESVKGAVDEICVVDTGSTDRTIEIAREAGAIVKEIAWENDFSKSRNAALAMATKRWIFVLDADEMLAPRSRPALAELRSRAAHLTGLWIRCFNLTDQQKGAGMVSNAIIRVFPNHERIRYRNPIHEFISLDDQIGGMSAVQSDIDIIHRGYLSEVMRERKKEERNLALAEDALRAGPDDPYSWYNYGTSALLAQKHDAAVSALERMRELSGDRPLGFVPTGLGTLADLYTGFRRDPVKGEAIARELVARVPTFQNAHFQLGKALAGQERFAEAREAFFAAIEAGKHAGDHFFVDHDVPTWKAQAQIGATLMAEKGYELAIAWFDFALKARPDAQVVRFERARAFEELGRLDEADAAFREAWENDRDEPSARQYLNFLARSDRPADALAHVEASIGALAPDTKLLFLGTAAALASSAGMPQADRYVERALGIAGVDHPFERLDALFRHYGSDRLLAFLSKRSNGGLNR